ncbi:MAG: hypothetical protein ACI9Y7_002678 [Dokdonia sp.]|jgi:hypothetical protein
MLSIERQRQTVIIESLSNLHNFKSKVSNYKNSKKLDFLITIKSNKFDTLLLDVFNHLNLKPERT